MEFKPFSEKQLTALTWWCNASRYRHNDAVICDGAVRSGKTLCMSLSFVSWAFYRFQNASFAICGKTIQSLRRNVVSPLESVLPSLGFNVKLLITRNILEIERDGRKNTFYLFGGRDESSAALIQGMTLSGVMLDEVALMPRSFVEQALARCSREGSKFWFNCNPEHPFHWFYREWILKAEEKNALYLHFKMEDNPSLSGSIVSRYQKLYSGAFYDRFVLGKWTAQDGLVYPDADRCGAIAEAPPDGYERYWISCDYGTVNPASMGLWGLHGGVYYRIDEFYYDSKKHGAQKTDGEYYDCLSELAGGRNIEYIVVDPSAASFIAVIRKHGTFRAVPAKNDVVDGIRRVSDALKNGTLKIDPRCKDSIREFSLYKWDGNASKDAPKKEHDHAMDDIRYFVSTVMNDCGEDFFTAVTVRRGDDANGFV